MNLSNVDIRGTNNYKGIVTIGIDVTEGLTTTLKAIGDGVGGYSPLKLSTTAIDIGTLAYLGGSTNAFPAIKRNGAAIDFRLADDSGFCNINALGISLLSANVVFNTSINFVSNNAAGASGLTVAANGGSSVGLDINGSSNTSNSIQRWRNASADTLAFIDGFGGGMFGGSSKNSSAMVQIDSTTKGFLPPRMTTTQRDNISTPAEGLVIYNTTTQVLNFYNGSAWGAV